MNNYCVGSRRRTGSFALQNLAVSYADKPHIGLVRAAKLWTLDNIVRVNGRMAISTPKAYLYFSFFILHYSLFIACSGKAAANSGLSCCLYHIKSTSGALGMGAVSIGSSRETSFLALFMPSRVISDWKYSSIAKSSSNAAKTLSLSFFE